MGPIGKIFVISKVYSGNRSSVVTGSVLMK